jgi:hypothetical protein
MCLLGVIRLCSQGLEDAPPVTQHPSLLSPLLLSPPDDPSAAAAAAGADCTVNSMVTSLPACLPYHGAVTAVTHH